VAVFVLALSAQSTSFAQAMELFRQHQWASAAASFAECEKASPGKTDALLYRGKSLINLGQFDDAAVALQRYREQQSNPRMRFTSWPTFDFAKTSRKTRCNCSPMRPN
jgi:thioredoxin-like negative regulator of GroEL